MTIEQWLEHATLKLKALEITSAKLDASLLLRHVIKKTSEFIVAHSDTQLSSAQLAALESMLSKRMDHTPVAYITHEKEFYGRSFFVDERVLIPRPESEAIIDLVKDVATEIDADVCIYDIGTGSGCLAITLSLELPKARITAADISLEVLEVAQHNAQKLEADVSFIQSDLLSSFTDLESSIIVANLPYVPEELVTSPEITKEPSLALFSGRDGLDHYKKLWSELAQQSSNPYYVCTESLIAQHQTMINLALSQNYRLVTTKDLVQLFTLISN